MKVVILCEKMFQLFSKISTFSLKLQLNFPRFYNSFNNNFFL